MKPILFKYPKNQQGKLLVQPYIRLRQEFESHVYSELGERSAFVNANGGHISAYIKEREKIIFLGALVGSDIIQEAIEDDEIISNFKIAFEKESPLIGACLLFVRFFS